jgi:hypothetical protein
MLQWLKGIEDDGETLTDKLKEAYVSPSATIKDVNCYQCGSGYMDVKALTFGGNDYSVSIYVNRAFEETTNERIIDGTQAGDDGFRISKVASRIFLSHNTFDYKISQALVFDSTWHKITATRVGNVLSVFVDDVFVPDEGTGSTLPISGDIDVIDNYSTIGMSRDHVAQPFVGLVANINVEGYFNLPSQEPYTVAYDTSGNQNNSHVNTLTPTISDGLPSHNAGIGFSLLSDEVNVTITKYYDDSVCTVMVSGDDIQKNGTANDLTFWDRFFPTYEWQKTYGIVSSFAQVAGNTTDDAAWPVLDSYMDADSGYFTIGNHGWNHTDVNVTGDQDAIDLQYVDSRTKQLAELNYPWQFTYKGSNYQTTFMQWGGMDGHDYSSYDFVQPTLAANNYLCIRTANTHLYASFGYGHTWDNNFGLFEPLWLTSNVTRVLSAGEEYKTDFDDAYDNKGLYFLFTHPYQDSDYPLLPDGSGGNEDRWNEWGTYIGNKDDVWYTDPMSYINYQYLRDVNPPVITDSEPDGSTMEVVVTGDPAARAKYGLSTPITYKIKKPAAWASAAVTVAYSDAENPTPTPMLVPRGDTLVVNGTFDDSGSGWLATGEATVNTGVGNIISAGDPAQIYQNLASPMVVSQDYTVEYDIKGTPTGSIKSGAGGITWPSTVGHHVVQFTADDIALTFKRGITPCDISIDNVILTEASDLFTAQNNFRDAGAYVYVSQGLPQESDSFTLLITKGA